MPVSKPKNKNKKRTCSLCGKRPDEVWRIFAHGSGAICNECIAEVADELNDAHVSRSSRQMPTEGREDLVLRRRSALDGVEGWRFLKDLGQPGTVGELIDHYATMCARLRRGGYEIPSIGDPRYLVTDALLAAYGSLASAEWWAGESALLRFDHGTLVVGSARQLSESNEGYLAERTKSRIRIVNAPLCAIRAWNDHLARLSDARRRKAA